MNAQRLLILAKHLDKHVSPSEFDLVGWYYETTCGTVACACGHATMIPAFAELGFRIVTLEGVMGPAYDLDFNGYRGWVAVGKFFDLCDADAAYLFSVMEYPRNTGPREVAARIEEFVKRTQ